MYSFLLEISNFCILIFFFRDQYEKLKEEKEAAENATVESFQKRKQLVNEKKAVIFNYKLFNSPLYKYY